MTKKSSKPLGPLVPPIFPPAELMTQDLPPVNPAFHQWIGSKTSPSWWFEGDPVETYWIGQILDRFPLGIQARNSKNSWVATTQFPIYPKQPGFFLETQNLCPHLTTSVFFIGACKVQVKCESAWALGGPWLGGCNSPLKTPELTNMTGIGKSPCSIGNTSWWIFQPVILVSP